VKFIATGGTDGNPYQGSVTSWFTYIPTEGADSGKVLPFETMGTITDRIGPVITSAVISQGKSVDTLSITFSESLADSNRRLDSLMEFLAWRSGSQVSNQSVVIKASRKGTGFRYDLLLNNGAPVVLGVGDSVRLIPGLASDMSGNHPHAKNPWVRIVGKQRSSVETPGVVTIDPDNAPGEDSPVVTVVAVPTDKKIDDVVKEQGVPGHLIRFDLSNLFNSDTTLTPADVQLNYEVFYFSNLGQYLNHDKKTIKCTDAIFEGDCSRHPSNIYLGWNARSEDGRIVGTGAYVSILDYSIMARDRTMAKTNDRSILGVIRK